MHNKNMLLKTTAGLLLIAFTTAFAAGGTALGGAVATIIHELFLPGLTAHGALPLGVVCSAVLAVAGGWAAPSKKAETEAYLGSVLAIAQYGDHGHLGKVTQVPVPVTETEQPASVPEEVETSDSYDLVDTAGTEYSTPAYALGK